jgi:hypothetical protein
MTDTTGTTGTTTEPTSSVTDTPTGSGETGTSTSGVGTDTATGTATGSETTADEPTTGDPAGPERILYLQVLKTGETQVTAVRGIEVIEGVASPPFTVLAAPKDSWLLADGYSYGHYDDRRWMPWFTPATGPARLWLVDVSMLTSHEVSLPPEIERIVSARLTHDRAGLIVTAAPLDDNSGDNLEIYVCPIGDDATCGLTHVDPPAPPMTVFGGVSSFSGQDGWIVYSFRAEAGPGVELFLGDLADPENATSLAAFPLEMGVGIEYSPDSKTMYLSTAVSHARYALDLASDPPGPLVELHPTLTTTKYREWNDDKTGVLYWVGEELFGDLHVQSVDGTVGGPLLHVHSAAPGHVQRKSYEWSPDGSRVTFLSDHETPLDTQLYMVDSAAPQPAPIKLNAPLGPGGRVGGSYFLPDEHVLYYATPQKGASQALFRASLEPAGDVVQISPLQPDFAGLISGGHDMTADGQRIVFRGKEAGKPAGLFLVDIVDGQPTPAVNLTASLPDGMGLSIMGYLLPGDDEHRSLTMITIDPQPQPPVQISQPGENVGFVMILPAL